jgi:hypothetical protein
VLVVALFLGISLASREHIVQSNANRSVLETEQDLKSVVQMVLAKVNVDLDIASPGNRFETGQSRKPDEYEPWSASPEIRLLMYNGASYGVELTDARWLPDLNTIQAQEWLHILQFLGMDESSAQSAAHAILEKKEVLLGRYGGYQNLDQFFSVLNMAPTIRYGARDGKSPGLLHLVAVGTATRATHPSFTPPIVYRALYNASDDQLKKLMALRARGPVSRQQEAELFGMAGQPAVANTPPALLKAIVAPDPTTGTKGAAGIVAFIAVNGTQARLVSEHLFYRE